MPSVDYATANYGNPDVFILFRISIFFYAVVGIATVFLVGIPASYLMRDERHCPRNAYALTVFGVSVELETKKNDVGGHEFPYGTISEDVRWRNPIPGGGGMVGLESQM